MNNRIILMSNENDGKGLVVKKFEEMNRGDLFQFIYEHKNARAAYLMPDVNADTFISDVKELASFDIYDKELSANDHIRVGQLINKTTDSTWSVVPLENVLYKLAVFVK